MNNTFLGISFFVWGGVCLVVAAIWAIFSPSRAVSSAGAYFILRWFHSLVWLLLALSCFVRGFSPGAGLANLLALAALGMYVVFIATLTRGGG